MTLKSWVHHRCYPTSPLYSKIDKSIVVYKYNIPKYQQQ